MTLHSSLLQIVYFLYKVYSGVKLFTTYQIFSPGTAGLGGVPEVRAPRYRVTFASVAPAGHLGHATCRGFFIFFFVAFF